MAKQTRSCVNCFIRLDNSDQVKLGEETPEVLSLIKAWAHAASVSEDDVICRECHRLAVAAIDDPDMVTERDRPHRLVCIVCGRSVSNHRCYQVIRESMARSEQLRYARILAKKIAPRMLKPNDEMCGPCYYKIRSKYPPAPPAPITDPFLGEGEKHEQVDEKPDIQILKANLPDPLPVCKGPGYDLDVNVKIEAKSDDEQDTASHNGLTEIKKEMDIDNVPTDVIEEIDTDNNPTDIKEEIETENVPIDFIEEIETDNVKTNVIEGIDNVPTKDFIAHQQEILQEVYDIENAHLLTADSVNMLSFSITGRKENKWQSSNREAIVCNKKVRQLQSDQIILPKIRRAPNTKSKCLFDSCKQTERSRIPNSKRLQILTQYKYFIPKHARICALHLNDNSFVELFSQNNLNIFTADHIEEMVTLISHQPGLTDFESYEDMDENLFDYWTGVTKEMFRKILSITGLDEMRNGCIGLAALLCKLRTQDSTQKLTKVFKMSRTNLDRLLLSAREAMLKHSECIEMVSSDVFTRSKKRYIRNYFGPKMRSESPERKGKQQKRKKRAMSDDQPSTRRSAEGEKQSEAIDDTPKSAKKQCKNIASNDKQPSNQ